MAKKPTGPAKGTREAIKSGMANPKAGAPKRGASGKFSAQDVLNNAAKGKTSISPRKPSVASAALKGSANKMKAQGAKANSMPTSRYSNTKPKGK